jgi:hypothetical protein
MALSHNADGSRQPKDRIFTAFRLVSDLGELAEVEGGPPGGSAVVLELEEGKVEVVSAPVVLRSSGGGGVRAVVGQEDGGVLNGYSRCVGFSSPPFPRILFGVGEICFTGTNCFGQWFIRKICVLVGECRRKVGSHRRMMIKRIMMFASMPADNAAYTIVAPIDETIFHQTTIGVVELRTPPRWV